MVEVPSTLQQDERAASAGMAEGPASSDGAAKMGGSQRVLDEAVDICREAAQVLMTQSAKLAAKLSEPARGLLDQNSGAAKTAVGILNP